MGGLPDEVLAAAILLAAPLAAGCVAYTPTQQAACGSPSAWSDRLVADEPGLYQALGGAMAQAGANGTGDSPAVAGWSGVPAAVEVVSAGERVHVAVEAEAPANASIPLDEPVVEGYGRLWLDQIRWFPEGDPSPHIAYEAPEGPDGNRTLMFRLLPEVGDPEVRHRMAQVFVSHLFPEAGADVLPRDLSNPAPHLVEAEAQAASFVSSALDLANATATSTSPAPEAFPRIGGVLVLEAPATGNVSGRVEVRLVHEAQTVLAPEADPPLALEATPGGRVALTAYAEEPLGREPLLATASELLGGVDGVQVEDLEDGRHRAAPACPS